MSNFGIKLDLLKIAGAFLTNFKGRTTTKRCLVIPIDDSGMYLGQKGLYLDLTAIELREPQFQDTHCIKQSLPKEQYEQLSEEQRQQLPILGGLRPIERKQEQMNITNTYDASTAAAAGEYSDVPF